MTRLCLSIIATTLLLTGCANMKEGSQQFVTIKTPVNVYNNDETTGMQCTLTNEEGTWKTKPYVPVKIDRDGNDLLINCSNGSKTRILTIPPELSLSYLFLDILGDICTISCAIDGVTDSIYFYPEIIVVPIEKKADIPTPTQIKRL